MTTRFDQGLPVQPNPEKKSPEKSPKNHLKKKRKKNVTKKCSTLSFSILGGRDSTEALQSIFFQNPRGGYPERDRVVGVGVAGQYLPFLI